MIETRRIAYSTDQLTAALRLRVPAAETQQVMGPGLAEVQSVIADRGVEPAGPWFTHRLRMPGEYFEFEICLSVASPVAAAGRVMPGRLPARKVAGTVYHGPYEGLTAAWGKFNAWIATEGLTPDEELWECYVAGPESGPDPSTWRTELNRPLVG